MIREYGVTVTRCEWAVCTRPVARFEGGFGHCAEHVALMRKQAAEQRRELAAQQRALIPAQRQPQALCGTTAGYRRHRRLGEDTCADCREANAQATAERRAARRAS